MIPDRRCSNKALNRCRSSVTLTVISTRSGHASGQPRRRRRRADGPPLQRAGRALARQDDGRLHARAPAPAGQAHRGTLHRRRPRRGRDALRRDAARRLELHDLHAVRHGRGDSSREDQAPRPGERRRADRRRRRRAAARHGRHDAVVRLGRRRGPRLPDRRSRSPRTRNGGFTLNAGCPPTSPVTIASRVWLHIIDPTGTEAATYRLGPFVDARRQGLRGAAGRGHRLHDGGGRRGHVAGGGVRRAHARQGHEAAGSTPSTSPLNPGLEMGAVLNVDFDGTANETLRLRIPVTTASPVGGLVFAGTPIDLPWGRKLQILDIGRLVDDGKGGKLISTLEADQPEDPSLTAGVPPSSATSGGRTALVSRKLLRTIAAEMTARGHGRVRLRDDDCLSWASRACERLGATLFVLYNALADAFVFQALANDWSGRYVLPAVPGRRSRSSSGTRRRAGSSRARTIANAGGHERASRTSARSTRPGRLRRCSWTRARSASCASRRRRSTPPGRSTRSASRSRWRRVSAPTERRRSHACPGSRSRTDRPSSFLDFTQATSREPSGVRVDAVLRRERRRSRRRRDRGRAGRRHASCTSRRASSTRPESATSP